MQPNCTPPRAPDQIARRTLASNGYMLVWVGKDHPMAEVRGYAYEHRIVAARSLGRHLRRGEIVHHIDGDKLNNAPSNLKVMPGIAAHRAEHRRRSDLRPHGAGNPIAECACGCREVFGKYDEYNRPRKYKMGHNPQNAPTMNAIVAAMQGGEAATKRIAEAAGVSRRLASVTLYKLKRRGRVERVRHGVWRLKPTPGSA